MKTTVLKLAAKAAYATAKKGRQFSFYLWNVSAERAEDTEKEQVN